MISRIIGTVIEVNEKSATVVAGGLGYEIFMAPMSLPNIGDDVNIETVLIVREDAHELYGFQSKTEKDLFKMLISVSGIGPKGALGILSLASPHDLASYIYKGDAGLFTRASGIGKKTAEKIIIELRDKVKDIAQSTETKDISNDVFDALIALGYNQNQIREALTNLSEEINTANTQETIRAVLKNIRSK
jgi:Holliday junction DNA helicase RuvA